LHFWGLGISLFWFLRTSTMGQNSREKLNDFNVKYVHTKSLLSIT